MLLRRSLLNWINFQLYICCSLFHRIYFIYKNHSLCIQVGRHVSEIKAQGKHTHLLKAVIMPKSFCMSLMSLSQLLRLVCLYSSFGLLICFVFCNFQVAFCVSSSLDQTEDKMFDLYQLLMAFQFCVKTSTFSFNLSDQLYSSEQIPA